jgi:hypothetical protein
MVQPESFSSLSPPFSQEKDARQFILSLTVLVITQIPPEKSQFSIPPRGAEVAKNMVTEKSKTSKRSM